MLPREILLNEYLKILRKENYFGLKGDLRAALLHEVHQLSLRQLDDRLEAYYDHQEMLYYS